MEQEVSLIQMLDARERRVWHQQELLGAYGKPLVCFTMNIAGPVKDSPLIRRGFARGRQLLERQFLRCGIKPLKIDLSKAVTGPEAFYVLDAEPLTIKKLTTLVEDASPLGRLFDMDVLRPDGKKVDREELHLEGVQQPPGASRSRAAGPDDGDPYRDDGYAGCRHGCPAGGAGPFV